MKLKVGDKVYHEKTLYQVREIFTSGLIHCKDEKGDLFGFSNSSLKLASEGNSPQKFDNDKPRLDLIRPEFTLGMGEALAYGAKKYNEPVGETPNYLKGEGFNYSRIIGSLERHIQQFKMGIDKDDESGLSHLKHAAVNLMFLLTYEESDHGIDDRVILKEKK